MFSIIASYMVYCSLSSVIIYISITLVFTGFTLRIYIYQDYNTGLQNRRLDVRVVSPLPEKSEAQGFSLLSFFVILIFSISAIATSIAESFFAFCNYSIYFFSQHQPAISRCLFSLAPEATTSCAPYARYFLF